MRTSALIAAALVLSLPAVPALAGDHSWQLGNNAYHVYFNDLDLHSVAGRAQALARVEKAAAVLCDGAGVRSEVTACETKAVQASIARGMAAPLRLALDERAAGARLLADAK